MIGSLFAFNDAYNTWIWKENYFKRCVTLVPTEIRVKRQWDRNTLFDQNKIKQSTVENAVDAIESIVLHIHNANVQY